MPMDRVEWTKEIEAEATTLRRELAETKMTKDERRSHRAAYVECLEILPQLTDAELEQLKLALLAEVMKHGDADLCREFLSNVDACPCCGRWMGHNRPPADDEGNPTPPKHHSSFDRLGRAPTTTTRRILEDLAAHGLISRHPQGQGKADRWKRTAWAAEEAD